LIPSYTSNGSASGENIPAGQEGDGTGTGGLKGAIIVEDHDDNIFDEDDGLDYIMYKEVEKEVNNPQAKTGCLGVLLVVIIPVTFVVGLVQL
jgi:hypothetical protein